MGYELPLGSKEDHDKQSGDFHPIEPDDYVVKIGKIVLGLQPTWNNGRPNYKKQVYGYTIIASPVALKGGGDMTDIEGNIVEPLKAYIFRNVNPFSLGFQQDGVTPSFMRGFIAYMRNMPVTQKVAAETFVLMSPGDNPEIIDDEEFLKQYLAEVTGEAPKDLIKQGYKPIPDIRMYEGAYIGCAIELQDSKKGLRNKISKWSKLPSKFTKPSDKDCEEFMTRVSEFWDKVKGVSSNNSYNKVSSIQDEGEIEEAGEVEIEDIPL